MNPNKPPSELWQALLSLKPFYKRAAWFSFIASLLMLAPSWYMLEVYDRVVNSRSHTTLFMLTILIVMLYVLLEVLEWVRAMLMHEASLVLDQKMSGRIFSMIFEANLKKIPGATFQPMNDFKNVRDFLASPVVLAAMEVPASFIALVLVFAISPVLGWISLVAACVQTFVGWLNERGTQPPLMQANQNAIAAQQYSDSTLRNAQVIESMGMLKNIELRWMKKQSDFLNMQAQASRAGGYYQALSKMIQNIVSSALLGVSAWLLLHNMLGGGAAFLIIGSVLGGRVLAPIAQVVAQWQAVVNVRTAYARLDAILSHIPPKPDAMPLPAPQGLLSVEQLVASAPGQQVPIIRGVQFMLMPGEVLAVVGPSGSGKTTLSRLLTGLWPAQGGKVRLGGADVYSWDKAELGPHVGYLPQGVELFEGTVAQNIARFGEVDAQKVQVAAQAVGLHEFILGLPQGYDTEVGEGGARFSGGERQRVALARALYGTPAFVVLDEPNSSLDEVGDQALAKAILQLKALGTTFVVVTHLSSVLAFSDKMLVLQEGQMQMFGPRDDVLKALADVRAKQQAVTNLSPAATQGHA